MSRHCIYDAVWGTLNLRQLRSVGVTANGQVIDGVTSAGVLIERIGGRKDLRASFETDDVASVCAISNIGTAGLAVSSGTITIPMQKRSNLASFASGSSHYALSGANGLLVPTSFGVSDMGPAVCSLEGVLTSTDGETAPVSELTAQSLASASFVALYGMGPIVVTTTGPTNLILDRPAGFTVRPGITVRPEYARGKNYPEEAFIIPPVAPVIEITCYDLETITAAVGGWHAITGLTCYLRKRSQTGWIADGTAEHIKFTFADGIADASVAASGPGQDGLKTYTFYGEALTIASAVEIE